MCSVIAVRNCVFECCYDTFPSTVCDSTCMHSQFAAGAGDDAEEDVEEKDAGKVLVQDELELWAYVLTDHKLRSFAFLSTGDASTGTLPLTLPV